MRRLTSKQEKFARNVVLNSGDKVKAYKDAGYAWKNLCTNALGVEANRLFKVPHVSLRIQLLQIQATEVAKKEFDVDARYVLRRLVEVDMMDIIDILDDDLKSFKPLKEWPEVWRQNIEGMDIITMTKGDEDFESIMRKVKWPSKTKNRELLGKHIMVNAFSEHVKVDANVHVKKGFKDFYDDIKEDE